MTLTLLKILGIRKKKELIFDQKEYDLLKFFKNHLKGGFKL